MVETVRFITYTKGEVTTGSLQVSAKGKWGWGGVAARNGLQLDNLGNGLRWESCIYWMLSESRTNSMWLGLSKILFTEGDEDEVVIGKETVLHG